MTDKKIPKPDWVSKWGEPYLTPESEEDLAKEGIKVPEWAKVDALNPTDKDDTILVCMPKSTPLMLPDNLVGACAWCQCPIQYRPHVPEWLTNKVCTNCAMQAATETKQ